MKGGWQECLVWASRLPWISLLHPQWRHRQCSYGGTHAICSHHWPQCCHVPNDILPCLPLQRWAGEVSAPCALVQGVGCNATFERKSKLYPLDWTRKWAVHCDHVFLCLLATAYTSRGMNSTPSIESVRLFKLQNQNEECKKCFLKRWQSMTVGSEQSVQFCVLPLNMGSSNPGKSLKRPIFLTGLASARWCDSVAA